ncbi:MAG: carboxypeptidase-like regulatory domain-containing protein [Coleofasciculaceae cyanobacterium]
MKRNVILPLILVPVLSWSAKAIAHGVKIEANPTQAIEIDAKFDNGEPMSNAQVTVYHPNNPSTPWLQATTNDKGNFLFAPDYSQPGNWTVQVRKAGHGDLINIAVGEEGRGGENISAAVEQDSSSQVLSISKQATVSPLQTFLMGAAGVWGFVGTALFFSRRKSSAHS